MKVRVSKEEIQQALWSIEWREFQFLPSFFEVEAEPLDPQPREAASPTEECCTLCWQGTYKSGYIKFCISPHCSCHQKEQPKCACGGDMPNAIHTFSSCKRIEEHPEKPVDKRCGLCRSANYGAGCFEKCSHAECHPEKPKKRINKFEADRYGLVSLEQNAINQIIDALEERGIILSKKSQ